MATREQVLAPYPLVSASQIDSYGAFEGGEGCPRKWLFKSVLKLETSQGEAASLGEDVDSHQLQPYLMEGKAIDFTRFRGKSGPIAATAISYLPPPKTPGLECQKHFVLPTFSSPGAGIPDSPHFGYQGYIDVWNRSSAILPVKVGILPHPDGVVIPLVGDFKTTGSWKWKKTAEKLKTDVQATLYAKWAMHIQRVDQVDLVWWYMRTKDAPICEPSVLRTTEESVDRRFATIEVAANEMFHLRREAPARVLIDEDKSPPEHDPSKSDFVRDSEMFVRNQARLKANEQLKKYILDQKPNTNHCTAFGGCPFKFACIGHMKPAQSLGSFGQAKRKEEGMSNPILEKMKKKAAEADAATASPPVTAPTPAPAGAPTPAPINPPESSLPAADPVGAVNTAALEAATDAGAEAPKRGRPKGSKNATPANLGAPAGSPASTLDEGKEFEVTWPEERYTNFGHGFGVGGLRVTGRVRAGETLEQAMMREHAQLGAVMKEIRAIHKAEHVAGTEAGLVPAKAA